MTTVKPDRSMKELLDFLEPAKRSWVESLHLAEDQTYNVNVDQSMIEVESDDPWKKYTLGDLQFMTITHVIIEQETHFKTNLERWSQQFKLHDGEWTISGKTIYVDMRQNEESRE